MTAKARSRIGARTRAAVALLVSVAGAAEAKGPPLIEPSGPWVMNYADDSCHLSRTFGTGDEVIAIQFRQFAPSKDLELLIAGKSLKAGGTKPLTTEFGPGGKPREDSSSLRGKLADGRAIFETTVPLPGSVYEQADRDKSKSNLEPDLPPKVDPEAEARITQLRIGGVFSRDRLLHLGPMDKPMDAMRACLDELLTHWGIDAVAHHSLTRPAVPTSDPQRWLLSDDYPVRLLSQSKSGVVHIRLMVDPQGKPTRCIVQTGGSEFDKITCELLLKRAKFAPALDAQGNPIASYYANTVRWIT